MNWLRWFFIFLSLFLVTTALNFIARKKMLFSYAVAPGYDGLYYLKGQTAITGLWEAENDSIALQFRGQGIKYNNRFKVYTGNTPITGARGSKLVFKPMQGLHTYSIQINDLPPVQAQISYSPDSLYRAKGNSGGQLFELIHADIPVTSSSFYDLSDWAMRFEQFNDPEHHAEADRYLSDSMGVTPTDRSQERVIKIARYILQVVRGMDGVPVDSLSALSPVRQLQCVQAGQSQLWCGNYAAIFSYFATRAGVPVRLVSCGDFEYTISRGTHVFNEVFIQELNKWCYVDLLAKTVFVQKGQQPLNVIDVSRLLRYNVHDSDLTALYFDGRDTATVPFTQVQSTAKYYFHPGNTFRFLFSSYLEKQTPRNMAERVQKAFWPKPYYALYGDGLIIRTEQLFIRIATTWLMPVLFLLTLFTGWKTLRRRKTAKNRGYR
jgi:hypothetical protein